MRLTLRYTLAAMAMLFAAGWAIGQTTKWKEIHKVKSKETIYRLAHENGISEEELMDANPEMREPGYKLKKGTYVFIPYPKQTATATTTQQAAPKQNAAASKAADGAVKVGVMLPLNNSNADGRRMVEYYRGVLMACDSLRQRGISVDIHAWNTPQGTDLTKPLNEAEASNCDLIIGPFYSTQVKPLANFAKEHGTKLLMPFATTSDDMGTNPYVFQVYQTPEDHTERVISQFLNKFAGYHAIFIDCNDHSSHKGVFTFGLRRQLESMGRKYSITNLTSKEEHFANAFSKTQPNVVILNTGRAPELSIAFAKINSLTALNPELKVTMFGYAEWLGYTQGQLDNFYKYDTYIPSDYFASPLSAENSRMEQKYHSTFREAMMPQQPRYAMMGFDHAYYFIKGLHDQGRAFTGGEGAVRYNAFQSPLRFEQSGEGGHKNTSLMFVHYTTDHKIEIISY